MHFLFSGLVLNHINISVNKLVILINIITYDSLFIIRPYNVNGKISLQL